METALSNTLGSLLILWNYLGWMWVKFGFLMKIVISVHHWMETQNCIQILNISFRKHSVHIEMASKPASRKRWARIIYLLTVKWWDTSLSRRLLFWEYHISRGLGKSGIYKTTEGGAEKWKCRLGGWNCIAAGTRHHFGGQKTNRRPQWSVSS